MRKAHHQTEQQPSQRIGGTDRRHPKPQTETEDWQHDRESHRSHPLGQGGRRTVLRGQPDGRREYSSIPPSDLYRQQIPRMGALYRAQEIAKPSKRPAIHTLQRVAPLNAGLDRLGLNSGNYTHPESEIERRARPLRPLLQTVDDGESIPNLIYGGDGQENYEERIDQPAPVHSTSLVGQVSNLQAD